MSYQTVSDILVGSQNNYDFQKKDLGNSAGGSGTSSFGELVSFYKNENKNGAGAFSGVSTSDVNYNNKNEINGADKSAVSNDDIDVKSNSQGENVKSSDYDSSENVSKTEDDANDKTEAKSADNEKDVSDAENNENESAKTGNEDAADNNSLLKSNNNNAESVLYDDCKDSKKVSGKKSNDKDSKNGKISKLTNKDFARIDQIGDQIGNQKSSAETASEVAVEKNIKNNKKTALNNIKSDENSEKNSDKKLSIKDSSNAENVEKENGLEEALKNAGAQNNANSVKVADGEDNRKLNISKKDNDNNDELLEVSGKGKSKDQIFMDKDKKISVQDLRTSVAEAVEAASEDGADNKSKFKVSEPKLINENTANITMEMRQNVASNVLSSNNQAAAANGSNFQAMLNNQIQQSAPEFVKAGNLILKDNNQGTINLLLRPDELGNVKLHLSLDGKNITGHITVATKEAMEVFKDNAETLREAFIKSGFESANFDVAYSGNNGAGQENAFQQQNDGKEFVAKKVYENHSENADGEFDKIVEKNDKNKEYSINIVA